MAKRIETLAELDQTLQKNPYFEISWRWVETDVERLAWHLLLGLPFDIDILLKGSHVIFDEDIDRIQGSNIELLFERYGKPFTVDNSELRDWLLTTPQENVAAYTARVVRRMEFQKVEDCYDPAQDFFADHWRDWDSYRQGEMKPRAFVEAIIDLIETLNKHIAEGKEMGLTMDEIILHDCIWGLLPENYDPDMISAARDMLSEAERIIAPMRPYIWSEKGKEDFAPRMLKFASERLQKAGVDIGLGKSYTTEQGYILNYFSRLYWREAASRPEE